MNLTVSEKDFQTAVFDLAKLRRWTYAHFLPALRRSGKWVTPMVGHVGFPDCVFAREGVVLFRELKTESGVVSLPQVHWGTQLGGLFAVWRPSDWDLIQQELR